MKKIMSAILLSLLTLNTFAGVITNEDTHEEIRIHQMDGKVIIESLDDSISGEMRVSRINPKESDIDLLFFTRDTAKFWNQFGLFPLNVPFITIAAVGDLVLLAPKGIVKGAVNSKLKNDVTKLQLAINTEENVEVGDSRFERIKELIRKSK